MKDQRLRVLAPDATHQHYKGGLYRYLGPLMDSDTGKQMRNEHGELLVAYVHCYPHERKVWARSLNEFLGRVGDKFRFRLIEGTI